MAFHRANQNQPGMPLTSYPYTGNPEFTSHDMESPDSPVTEVEELFERLETYSPLRRLAGSILMFGVTNLVTRNGATTGGIVSKLLSGVSRKRDTAGKHLSSGDAV